MIGLVAAACFFNLWVLNSEATPVHDLNDSSYHFAMLRWARTKIEQGRLPLDGWYPDLGLGLAQFHHYQSLPHVIGGYVSFIFGEATTFYWSLYLLLALWPISVYICMRLLGWERWTEIGTRYNIGVITSLLTDAIASGQIPQQPIEATALTMLGAVREATLYVARAKNQRQARKDAGAVMDRLIDALRV